jgi:hypothetical protein
LVLDQVRHVDFVRHLATSPMRGTGWGPYPLDLDYVPRTTPVGHATISTGLLPAQHRIQGRLWFDHTRSTTTPQRAEDVTSTFPVIGSVFEEIYKHSLARQIRYREGAAASIVVAAAKNFIPFLFGAWDTDVSVYPRTIAPEQTLAGPAIEVVLDAFTPRGDAAIQRAASALLFRASSLVGPDWLVQWLPQQPSTLGPGHRRHVMQWQVPTTWGRSLPQSRRRWREFLDMRIVAVDEFYARTLELLLGEMNTPGTEFALQSCVATD